VEPGGADPCELRQSKGDAAVRDLIGTRRPLFEFAIRAALKRHNLDTVEGRIAALRESAPVVAQIRDAGIRPAYARELAGWLGMPVEEVSRAVAAAAKRSAQQPAGGGSAPGVAPLPPSPVLPSFNRPDPRDPVAAMERQALEVALQQPGMLEGETWQRFSEARFSTPAYLAIQEAIRANGLALTGDPVRWVEQLLQEVPEPLRPLVSELAVVPLPASTADGVLRYCRDILARLFELQITRVKAEKMGQLQRLDATSDPEAFQRLNRELMQLEMQRRSLRAEG
jgi:DNA primase